MVEVVAVPEDAFVENPKLEEIFSSIEKQLIMQTGFFKINAVSSSKSGKIC